MTLADIIRPKLLEPSEAEIIQEAAPEPSRASRVLAVWGSAGSGKTTLAINLGFEFATLGMRVLIIDADSYRPSVAAALGFTDQGPGITAVLRLARSNRLSVEELERLTEEVQFDSHKLRILTGLNSPSRWAELDAPALTELLEFARSEFDMVVLDLASETEPGLLTATSAVSRNTATNCLLEKADLALGVFGADPVGVNRFLWDCRNASIEFWPIANRMRSSVIGKNPARQLKDTIHRLARLEIKALVPDDQAAIDTSIASAKPLCLSSKNSKAREAIRALALDIMDHPGYD